MTGSTRSEVILGAASTSISAAPSDEQWRDLMMGFCSLGNNCDFGQAQRTYKAEPIDLFRWSATPFKVIMALLERRFEDIGNPSALEVKETPHGEYMVRNLSYGFEWHAFADKTNSNPKDIHDREVKRLPYLARKFMEDVHDAQRIFVIKTFGWLSLTEADAAHIVDLMSAYGGKPTLLLVHDGAEAPHVEQISGGLLHGYIVKFADPADVVRTTPSEEWLALCQITAAMRAA